MRNCASRAGLAACLVLLVAQTAAAQSYVFEPPAPIAGSSAMLDILPPAAAYGGGQFLVVWQQPADGGTDLHGALVSAVTGAVAVGPFEVSRANGFQQDPGVARRAADFLVTWNDTRAFPTTGTNFTEIYGARVSDLGVTLDPLGVVISEALQQQTQKFVSRPACYGDSCVVVWSERFPIIDWQILSARLNPQTLAAIDGGVSISPTMRPQFLPTIAPCDGGYCVMWSTDTSNRYPADFIALDRSGLPVGMPHRLSTGGTVAFRPALVAPGGTPYGAWLEAAGAGNNSLEGGPVGVAPQLSLLPPANRTFDHLSAAWDGERVWLAWSTLGQPADPPAVNVYALDDAGLPGEGQTIANAVAPVLASNGAGLVFLAWYAWSPATSAGAVTHRLIRRVGLDGGSLDGGMSDAGVGDAGVGDAGASDAGAGDAGRSDAGVSDAGMSDAGADAGPADGGTAGLPVREHTVGCACSTGGAPLGLLILLMLLALASTTAGRSVPIRSVSGRVGRLNATGSSPSTSTPTPTKPRQP